jgi:hypothetical protein
MSYKSNELGKLPKLTLFNIQKIPNIYIEEIGIKYREVRIESMKLFIDIYNYYKQKNKTKDQCISILKSKFDEQLCNKLIGQFETGILIFQILKELKSTFREMYDLEIKEFENKIIILKNILKYNNGNGGISNRLDSLILQSKLPELPITLQAPEAPTNKKIKKRILLKK